MIRRAGAPPFLLGAAAVCSAAAVVGALGGGDIGWILLPFTAAAFLAGRAPTRPAGALAIALLLAAVAVSQVIDYEGDDLVPELMVPVTFYLAGLALRSRETLAERLSAQAEELELERDAYARLSVRYERARIAAELHDVVAHAISVMVVQASAGQRLAVRDPSATAETFGVIATAARQAQADLDRLADLLARDAAYDGGADLGLIREIVDTARASGLPVSLQMAGDVSILSAALAHTALRIVQEGVTNALRYAPGAAVEVAVAARPGALELSVVNGRATGGASLGLGSGRGLRGLRERVGAREGTLHAGPTDAGGWALRARMPC